VAAAAIEDDAAVAAYAWMDATRCLLAVVVAFSHAWYLLIEDYDGSRNPFIMAAYAAAGFAHACVILFFVLSGYWITRSVIGRESRGWNWTGYLIDRIARLSIVVVPALLIGGALDLWALATLDSPTYRGETGTYVMDYDITATMTPTVLLGNILFLQTIAVPIFGSNGPLWSVAFEFWYYLWFPALYLSFRRRRLSLMLATLFVGLLSLSLWIGFLSWLCGAALALAPRDGRFMRWVERRPLAIAGAMFAAMLALIRMIDFPAEDLLLAAAFALFLASLLRRAAQPARWVAPIARYGARASFSLYAIHFPMLTLATALLVNRERLDANVASLGVVLMLLLANIVAAWFFAGLTEAHTGRLRRRAERLLVFGAGR